MKKFFFLLSIIIFTLSTMAEGTPNVIVHKSNGGHWAWLNLYNDILYTPAEDESHPATLECTGSGFSSCRVPRFNAFASASLPEAISAQAENAIRDAINDLILQSEKFGAKGTMKGQTSKTIAVANPGTRGYKTYFIKAQWDYAPNGEGVMYIYVTQSDLLNNKR